MRNHCFFTLLVLCLSFFGSKAQPEPVSRRVIDSLQKFLESSPDDTSKCSRLNAMSTMLWQKGEYEAASDYAIRARNLSIKLNFQRGVGSSYNNTGTVLWYKGNYNEALKDYITSLTVMEKINHKAGISDAANNIGMVYYSLGNFEKTIEYYKRSLQIDEESGNKGGIALSWNNIGGVYEEEGRTDKKNGDLKKAMENAANAEECFRKSLKICEENKIKPGLALGYSNMGSILVERAELADLMEQSSGVDALLHEGKTYYEKALAVKTENGDEYGISGTYVSLGELAYQMDQFPLSEKYFNYALQIAQRLGAKDRAVSCYNGLSMTMEAQGNLKEALHYHKLYFTEQDSIYKDEMAGEIAEMQTKYDTEKKEEQIKILDKDKQIQAAQIKEQRLIIWFVAAGLLVVFAFAGILYNRFRVIKKQKAVIAEQKLIVDQAFEQLHEKNKEITDSIYYARRIQRALVTNDKYIQKHLSRMLG